MMDINDLIDLCGEYADLGWAVQEQLVSVLRDEPLEEQNNNALEMIVGFLRIARECGVKNVDGIIERIEEHIGA